MSAIHDYRTTVPVPESVEEPRLVPRRRNRLDPFPRTSPRRWLLRLALASPFALFAILTDAATHASIVSVNDSLIQQVAAIEWDRADLAWVGSLYPPFTTIIAALAPDSLALALVGSLAAGGLLQKVLESLVQRDFARSTIACLLIALAANPLFFFVATENLPGIVGICFFGAGVIEVFRFVTWRNTRSGFRAGLLLMMASLSDVSGLLYVGTAMICAPLISLGRSGQRGARGSNVLVITFPTVAVFGSVIFLQTVFLRSPFQVFDGRIGFDAARLQIIPDLVTTVNGALLLAPLICLWIIAILIRRPGAIILATLVFISLIVGYLFQAIPTTAAGNVFLVMLLMAVALFPKAKTPAIILLMNLMAIVQIAIAWAAAFNRPIVEEWMSGVATIFSV